VRAAILAVGLALAGCGSDPVCGDGHRDPDLGEQCDDGNDVDDDACHNNCTANVPGTFTILWAFNKDDTVGFTGDNCTDMGVTQVQVDLSGPATASLTDSCSLRQVVFSDLVAGTYLIEVTPLDINGNAKVGAPVQATVALSPGIMHEVVIPYTAWTDSYTGTLFFRTRWAGQDCDAAVPPVTQHRFLLELETGPATQMTDEGDKLDGTAPGACRSVLEEFPQSALAIPFGPATFTIEGRDTDGTTQFSETFATFVGAGITNPEYMFDVASLAPDAGVPDAL
jgi:cysteine-rich repeat protein